MVKLCLRKMKLLLLLSLFQVVAHGGKFLEYVVLVKTSDLDEAGTDAKIYIKIHGDTGVTDSKQLDNSDDNHERGSIDKFDITARDVGRVTGVEVFRHNHRQGWHLNNIAVQVGNQSDFIEFDFKTWIKENQWYLLSPPCPRDWFQGISRSCYLIRDDAPTWGYSAKSACEALGSSLAVLHTEAEQKALVPFVQKDALIGLHRDPKNKSQWLWADGSSVNYNNWNDGEPNNDGGKENCVQMLRRSGKWKDVPCDIAEDYICQINSIF